MQEKWEKFSNEAKKKINELESLGSKWLSDFDDLEKSGNDLISEINKEIESSSKDVSKELRKFWQKRLIEASVARKKLRNDLEKRLEAVKRSEKHLEKAIKELKK
jgi:hypothetical protein